jgi:hypothetical protein
VTTVKALYYSPEDYAKFTPTKKQKHFQLMQATKATRNSGKTNNSSATVAELTTAVSTVSTAALAISKLTAATTKRAAADVERPLTLMRLLNPNGDVTAITLHLLAIKSTCLRSQRPD